MVRCREGGVSGPRWCCCLCRWESCRRGPVGWVRAGLSAWAVFIEGVYTAAEHRSQPLSVRRGQWGRGPGDLGHASVGGGAIHRETECQRERDRETVRCFLERKQQSRCATSCGAPRPLAAWRSAWRPNGRFLLGILTLPWPGYPSTSISCKGTTTSARCRLCSPPPFWNLLMGRGLRGGGALPGRIGL